MLLFFVLLLENVSHSQYIPYVSYFHIYVFLFCDDELHMLKSNKTSVLFCSVLSKIDVRQFLADKHNSKLSNTVIIFLRHSF